MFIKSVARSLWRPEPKHPYDTWYEPLDEQATIDAAVAFALSRSAVTGLATVGDVRLLPLMIEADRRRAGIAVEVAVEELANQPEFEPLFVRVAGREFPDWL